MEEVTAAVLLKLKSVAERELRLTCPGAVVDRAVRGNPTALADHLCTVLLKRHDAASNQGCCQIAGLECLRLVNEPTAAVFGTLGQLSEDVGDKNVRYPVRGLAYCVAADAWCGVADIGVRPGWPSV
jgi:molecular chaperone DnaK (HSP70)